LGRPGHSRSGATDCLGPEIRRVGRSPNCMFLGHGARVANQEGRRTGAQPGFAFFRARKDKQAQTSPLIPSSPGTPRISVWSGGGKGFFAGWAVRVLGDFFKCGPYGVFALEETAFGLFSCPPSHAHDDSRLPRWPAHGWAPPPSQETPCGSDGTGCNAAEGQTARPTNNSKRQRQRPKWDRNLFFLAEHETD